VADLSLESHGSLADLLGPARYRVVSTLSGPAENTVDPTTHLELTMIHEVMVLDHGGVDLAFIQYASALKLWVLGALVVGLLAPVRTGIPIADAAAFGGGMIGLAIVTGVVESSMARLRLPFVPQLLIGAAALSALALGLVLWVTP
jgi:formate hydrogenlyase subunit 4